MPYRSCFSHLQDIERRRIPPTPEDHLRLHRLERPAPWPPDLLDEIWLAQQNISFYPDYAPFVRRVAKFARQPEDRIVIGHGSEGLIRDLFMLCCDPGSRVAFPWPTCAMFDIYARVFAAEPSYISSPPDGGLSVAALLEQVPIDCRLLILPNPGQPIETCYSPNEMREIADFCKEIDCLLAVDEAYYHFGGPTCELLIEDYDNVVILRSFSKALGAAGIRIGFAMGSQAAIHPLEAVRASGEVSGPSMAAATVLMDRWFTHVRPGIAQIRAGRSWIVRELVSRGFTVHGQRANHVLIEVEDSQRVAENLLARKVCIRAGFSPPLDRHILVTCGPTEMMQEFLSAFMESIE